MHNLKLHAQLMCTANYAVAMMRRSIWFQKYVLSGSSLQYSVKLFYEKWILYTSAAFGKSVPSIYIAETSHHTLCTTSLLAASKRSSTQKMLSKTVLGRFILSG